MSYTHMKVVDIAKKDEIAERGLPSFGEVYSNLLDDPNYPTFLLDGVLVPEQVKILCEALRGQRAFADCLFGVGRDRVMTSTQRSVFVYFPDEIFARGTIGYGLVGITRPCNKYFVSAHGITNKKVSDHRELHYTASSDNISRAMGFAKQYLKKYSTETVLKVTFDELSYLVKESLTAAFSNRHSKQRILERGLDSREGGLLAAELRHMVNIGYEFTNSDLAFEVKNYLFTVDEEKKQQTRKVVVTFVMVDNLHKEFVVRKVPHPINLDTFSYDVMGLLQMSESAHYTEETLPGEVLGAVSSLNILDSGQFVDGLGWRQSESIYYLVSDYKGEG